MSDDQLSAAQAAEVLGISDRRARMLADELGAERDELGKLWFSREAVERFQETRRPKAGVPRSKTQTEILGEILDEVREIRRQLDDRQ